MKVLPLALLLAALPLLGHNEEQDWNVNSRYTVESATVQSDVAVSRKLLREIKRLEGNRVNLEAVTRLSIRLQDELHGRTIQYRLERGSQDGQLKVVWQVDAAPPVLPTATPVLQYAGSRSLTNEIWVHQAIEGRDLTLKLGTNSNSSLEDRSGVSALYRRSLFDGLLQVSVEAAAYRENWHGETAAVTPAEDRYTSRQSIEPVVEIAVAPGLTVCGGATVQRLRGVTDSAAGKTVQGVLAGVNYKHSWISAGYAAESVAADYSLRSSAEALGSDYGYTRHLWRTSYSWSGGRYKATVNAAVGILEGKAPIFDRFVLGNSERLRGWDQLQIAPAGADRLSYASFEYGNARCLAFYDTGAVWNSGKAISWRHSAGFGVRRGPMLIGLAVPLRANDAVPVLIASLRF